MAELATHIQQIGLLFDFGLVVLIFMVQLIVYPSFLHYSSQALLQWHEKYTKSISRLVVPLMFGQLAILLFRSIGTPSYPAFASLVLVIAVWWLTFARFVPMHHAISKGKGDTAVLQRLVQLNWWRTFLWSAIFLVDFTVYL
ncbi:hypothetical protein [Maribacter sp. 2-571]|uniref:hypothetical protein n=1 Tax=Maribacter sp. 2-571 TaxID=3417569 RepID=UPI003D3251C9